MKCVGRVRCLAVVGRYYLFVLGLMVYQIMRATSGSWPAWRGIDGSGAAAGGNPPVQWSESKNIRWKITLPGKGHSSPIVWQDSVYLTAAIPYGDPVEPVFNNAPGAHDNFPVTQNRRFVVLAVNRQDGKERWQTEVVREFPHEGGHYAGSLASNSPVTDGERIYASFGSRGLYALNPAGEVVWKQRLGRMETKHAHGEGSSPALSKGVLVHNWDHEKQSFLVAFNANDGEERWRVQRDELTSWSSPLIVRHGAQSQVIVSATKRVRSYDLHTGRLIWECAGLAHNVVASPVATNGIVIVGNSYDKQAMMAIRLEGARGDITGTSEVVWTLNRMTPYVPSPLIYDDTLYFLRHNQGVLSCLDPLTGKVKRGPFRLGGLREIFASPVGVADRIYVTGRNGATLVFSHGENPRALALNQLNDQFSASAAIAGDEIYLRGEKNLYCIAAPE
ncbi:MAG: Outer membrane protein assembly factor BamB [Verrucomicrobia subdivision 3 bacterium]|nr:Outer membrane protein assembly factor BamB [Limisphaerales bacterium]MCS1415506.1 Outer membrane protein assembly factor BamB [Limisphaerales bacterium]